MKLSECFTAIAASLPARRGNLYEQYFERAGADGKTRRFGPYYVWTRCEDGKMVSERVSREDAPLVREQIAKGKLLDSLLQQLWQLAENMARNAGEKKKSSRKSMGRPERSSPKR